MPAIQNEEGPQAVGTQTPSVKSPTEDSAFRLNPMVPLGRETVFYEFRETTRPLKLTLVLNTRNHSLEGAYEPGPWNEEWGVGRKGRTRENHTFIRQPIVSGPQ